MTLIFKVFTAFIAVSLLFSGCANGKLSENDVTRQTDQMTPNYTASSYAESTDEASADTEEAPTETPIYDCTAILSAYSTGDVSKLSEKDLAIYNAAVDAVSEFYRDGMDDVEIITAAHDWLVTHVVYDEGMLLAVPKKQDDTENPYGALVLHQGICMGYTTSFQLFMDMLGVDSQIIRGMGYGSDIWEEHAWNLVCVDGKYYHVDATWDDFVPDEEGRIPFHLYMLVPDSVMEVLHRWEHEDYPEAVSSDLNYFINNGLYAKDAETVKKIQKQAHKNGDGYCEIMTDGDSAAFDPCAYAYWANDLGDYYVTIYWIS